MCRQLCGQAGTPEARRRSVEEIASIIDNRPLAAAICRSVHSALACPFVRLGGSTAMELFQRSLKAAVRDIESHPRGELFRRLIEFGPHNPDEPKATTCGGKTVLSDPECGECVEFIFSHMVNRFKGELAELLAIEPCVALMRRLLDGGSLPSGIRLYWGDLVQERFYRKSKRGRTERTDGGWSQFVKGADGLLIEHIGATRPLPDALKVRGAIEVKSMVLPDSRLVRQIDKHITRLRGGVKLAGQEWPADKVDGSVALRVMVRPGTWTLSREYHWEERESGRVIVFPEKSDPPVSSKVEEVSAGLWSVTLDWSGEAIEEAAYNMTFRYMGDVGQCVYSNTPLPNSWQEMTAEQGGYNAIKMMLYYIMLRPLSERHDRLATRLYNVYCFGYPLGVDSREMLWPQDFPDGG